MESSPINCPGPSRANHNGSRPRILFSTRARPEIMISSSRARSPSATMISPFAKSLPLPEGKMLFHLPAPDAIPTLYPDLSSPFQPRP